jgi:hypothetical protein
MDGAHSEPDNVFYSVASIAETFFTSGRGKAGKDDFAFQEWIPFDIDDVNKARELTCISVLDDILPTDGERIYIWTGHGMQVLYRVPIFTDTGLFGSLRSAYRSLCIDIEVAFRAKCLTGTVDTTAWDVAKMFRLPGTINQKWNLDGSRKTPKSCYLIETRGSGASQGLWDKMAGQVISVPPKVSSGYSICGSTFHGAPVLVEREVEVMPQANKTCSCPMNLLLLRGCKCGGV